MRGGQPALGPLIVLYPPKKVLNQFEATKQLGGLSRTWGQPASAKRFLCGVKQVAGDTTHEFWREQPRISGKIMEDHQEQWINLWVPPRWFAIRDGWAISVVQYWKEPQNHHETVSWNPFYLEWSLFGWCKEPRGSVSFTGLHRWKTCCRPQVALEVEVCRRFGARGARGTLVAPTINGNIDQRRPF